MRCTCPTTLLIFAALASASFAHAGKTGVPSTVETPSMAMRSGPTLRGVAFPAASIDEAESIANRLGFECLVRTGPGWRVISRLHTGSLLWYAAGHDTAIGGHGDTLAVPLFTGFPAGIDVGLPVGAWTEAEGDAEAMPHPNRAILIVGMVAEVPDLDAACKAWTRAGATCGWLVEDKVLGRPKRVVQLPGGEIDLVAPLSPTQGHVGSAKAHWLGVRIALTDLRGVDEHGVKSPWVPNRITPLDGRTNLASGIQVLFVDRPPVHH